MDQWHQNPRKYEDDGYSAEGDDEVMNGRFWFRFQEFEPIRSSEYAAYLKTKIDGERLDQRVIDREFTWLNSPAFHKWLAVGGGIFLLCWFGVHVSRQRR